jgi:tetratricopeptide (TPR) repeat protein
MANGDSLGAEKDFKKSLETETDKQFLYYNIACYYLMRPTSIYKEKVKYYFSKALDLNDSLIGAYKLLAYEYIQEGNIKEAIKTLEKAEKRHAKTIYGEDLKQCRIAFENEFKKGIKTNYDMDLIYYYPGQSSIIQRILKEAEKKSSISKKRIKL